jgi:hypothetical protein
MPTGSPLKDIVRVLVATFSGGLFNTRQRRHYRDCCAAARCILLPHVSPAVRPQRSAARHCSPTSCASQSTNPAHRTATQ